MCFPDNYIWEVVVPMTNRYIDGPNMTLQDFYVWLGCINQLRATNIKTNLLVILKIDFFDYDVANCSSITMVPNVIFRLGVCRLVPCGVIPISRGSGKIVSPHSLFPI